MELQVAVPVPTSPATDFNFDSTCSSPYMTAPSSPRRFGTSVAPGSFYFSAPPSPTRISAAFYSDLSVPFKWEDKPGVPAARQKPPADEDEDDGDEFEFDFSGQLDRASLSGLSAADELFDGGKIRPLKPPPGTPLAGSSPSPRSPRSPRSMISQALAISSPKRRKEDFEVDPFAAAIEENRRKETASSAASRTRSRTRSLSPMRVSDVVFSPEEGSVVAKPAGSAYSAFMSAIYSRKWRLKDLLFRSASEGRAPRNDDVLRSTAPPNHGGRGSKIAANEDVRNSSFRSTDSVGSVSSRRRVPASAHEIHYTANRAVSEEMRKKTFLPYKQGLLGCLGFSPGVHEVSRRFGSFSRA